MLRQATRTADEHGHAQLVPASRDAIDLDRLSPQARALAETIAISRDAQAGEILLELAEGHDDDTTIGRYAAAHPGQVRRARRAVWSRWDKFRADDHSDAHGWLERQAAKLPHGCRVIGPHEWPQHPDGLTLPQVLTLLGRFGITVKPSTWRAYVARKEELKPVAHIGRTPLWDMSQIIAWAKTRPGRGNWATGRGTRNF